MLGGIVVQLDGGLREDGHVVAEAGVGFLDGVVVDAVDLNVFVAARGGVQARAGGLRRSRRRSGGGWAFLLSERESSPQKDNAKEARQPLL